MGYKHSDLSLDQTFWTQATWFVDPANSSGVASDLNSGIDTAHPVRTYNGGVVARWGTTSPTLRQNTTVTFMSSQTDYSDPVVWLPECVNAVAMLVGQLGAAQRIASGVLGVTVPRTFSPPALLQPDFGVALPVGTLVKNTQPGKTSFAFVYTDPGTGSTARSMSQPLTPCPLPFGNIASAAQTEINTWALGDTFEAYTPITVVVVSIGCLAAQYVTAGFDFPAQMQMQHITVPSFSGAAQNTFFVENDVTVTECRIVSTWADQQATDDEVTYLSNVDFAGGAVTGGSNPSFVFCVGGIIRTDALPASINWNLVNDVILDTTSGFVLAAMTPFIQTSILDGTVSIGSVYVSAPGTFSIAGIVNLQQNTLYSQPTRIWGPGGLDFVGRAWGIYRSAGGSAVATFQQTGGFAMNGQSNANPVDPTTGTIEGGIPLTAINLDAAYGVAGFGGNAINMTGAGLTNVAPP